MALTVLVTQAHRYLYYKYANFVPKSTMVQVW